MEKEYYGIKIDMENPLHKKIIPEEVRDLEEKFGFAGLSEKYVEIIAGSVERSQLPDDCKNDPDFMRSLFIGRFANFINIYYCLYRGVTETIARLDEEIQNLPMEDEGVPTTEIIIKQAQCKAMSDVIETLDTLLDMEVSDKMKKLGFNLVPENIKANPEEEVKENV